MDGFLKKVILLCLLSLAFFVSVSHAAGVTLSQQQVQAAYSVAGQVDPGRVGASVGMPAFKQPKALKMTLAAEHKYQPIAAADKIHFALQQVNFSGNTVFTAAELNTLFYPILHKTISLAQLQA